MIVFILQDHIHDALERSAKEIHDETLLGADDLKTFEAIEILEVAETLLIGFISIAFGSKEDRPGSSHLIWIAEAIGRDQLISGKFALCPFVDQIVNQRALLCKGILCFIHMLDALHIVAVWTAIHLF